MRTPNLAISRGCCDVTEIRNHDSVVPKSQMLAKISSPVTNRPTKIAVSMPTNPDPTCCALQKQNVKHRLHPLLALSPAFKISPAEPLHSRSHTQYCSLMHVQSQIVHRSIGSFCKIQHRSSSRVHCTQVGLGHDRPLFPIFIATLEPVGFPKHSDMHIRGLRIDLWSRTSCLQLWTTRLSLRHLLCLHLFGGSCPFVQQLFGRHVFLARLFPAPSDD